MYPLLTMGVKEASPSVQITDTDEEDLILAIIEAVAAAKGKDPTTLDLHLADQIALDELAALYAHSERFDTTWTMEFPVDEYRVTVNSDGQITAS